ncbi:MAG: cytochrome b [Mizugakiibacter sp.]|uniref:cytochrome b n=1 Tax=Mizugakiibacter sp. TaxID=1972610 RepID=UPI0031BD7A51|nr:cytochrome b [Xanthomonadaceae bacterium]
MPLRSSDARWGALAQFFHWTVALLIVAQGAIGLSMVEMATTPAKVKVYALHKSIGLTVLALALLRLAWRAADRRPADPPAMPRWQVRASRLTHAALYALILAIPLSGWLFNSAANFPLSWFGLLHVPSLTAGADPALKALARGTHEALFWILAAVLALHVGAALKHHLADRDDVLARMLPWRTRRASASAGDPAR